MKLSKRQVNDRFVIDLGLEDPKRDQVRQVMSSVSILLGAGFSAPAGYPLGEQMNRKLLEFDFPIAFHQFGVLVDTTGHLHSEAYPNSYQETFVYCKRLISWYEKNYTFDYEAFYDVLASGKFKEFGDDSLFEELSTIDRSCGWLRPSVLLVYTQMVLYLLKDKNGQSFYDDRELNPEIISHYNSFMRLISELRKASVVNVHTLNHDLLFEALNKTEYDRNSISDGFDEYGSEYFGILRIGNSSHHCRLERYTGKYDTGVRLFKLHGSIDRVPFSRKSDDNVFRLENYVKVKSRISPTEILRDNEKKDGYEISQLECHADFLSGYINKQLRYDEPVLYKKLFEDFRSNLRQATELIIVGYGCKDDGINSIIKECFDHKNKPVFIVDNHASNCVKGFANSIGAKLIECGIESLSSDMV